MPERIAHRDLRNRSSEILRNVQNGAAYEVTNHGEVVALISPASQPGRRELQIRKARHRGGFASLQRVERSVRMQDSLDELRGDR